MFKPKGLAAFTQTYKIRCCLILVCKKTTYSPPVITAYSPPVIKCLASLHLFITLLFFSSMEVGWRLACKGQVGTWNVTTNIMYRSYL